MLQKYHPLFLSIHANHPRELTAEVKEALERLANHGVPMGNQSVFLRGVNDDVETMRASGSQADHVSGATVLSVSNGPDQRLRPLCAHSCCQRESRSFRDCVVIRPDTLVPQYVIDAPGGGGKVPVNPDYVLQQNEERVVIRNFEGRSFEYPEPAVEEEKENAKETVPVN